MKTKLIFVEGLPGSGKSSTAQYLWMQLQKQGASCRWYYEEVSPHPLALFDRDSGNKTVPEIISDGLKKWKAFVSEAKQTDEIRIIESRLLLDNIFPLVMKEIEKSKIAAFIHAVIGECRGLDPVLIYFHQFDYSNTLRRICQQRGEYIEKIYIQRAEKSLFGRRRGLRGFGGLVQFWTAVGEIADQLYEEVAIPKIAIDNSGWQWPVYYRQMCDFLGIPWHDNPPREDGYLRKYSGTYGCQFNDEPREFTIRLHNGQLVIRNFPWLWPEDRLIPKEDNVFYVASWPFELVFHEDASGAITGMRKETLAGDWRKQDQVFPKKKGSE